MDSFQFLGIPPKGEHQATLALNYANSLFPISRDPPEGGTVKQPEQAVNCSGGFQFLGIPPKGERQKSSACLPA